MHSACGWGVDPTGHRPQAPLLMQLPPPWLRFTLGAAWRLNCAPGILQGPSQSSSAWPTFPGPGALVVSQLWVFPDLDPELLHTPAPSFRVCSSVGALTQRGKEDWACGGLRFSSPWWASPSRLLMFRHRRRQGPSSCPRSGSACQADLNTPWGDPSSSWGEPQILGERPGTQRKPQHRLSHAHFPAHCLQKEEGRPPVLQRGTSPSLGTLQDMDRTDQPCRGCWEDGSCSVLGAEAAGHQWALSPRGCSFSLVGLSGPHSNVGSPPACPRQQRPVLPSVLWPPEALTRFSVTSSDRKASPLSPGAAMGPGLALWPPVEVPGSQDLTAGFLLLPTPSGLWGHFHRKDPALCDCHVSHVKATCSGANPCVSLSPEQNVNRCRTAKGVQAFLTHKGFYQNLSLGTEELGHLIGLRPTPGKKE